MPECVLSNYLEQIPRLRAERALAAAQVVSLPWMKEGAQQRWYDAQRAVLAPVESQVERSYVLTFNGARLGLPSLRQKVGAALGGGFSE